ncbi:MAG: hypothetical protein QNJ71_01935 [Acidimicrobiia bacterium]|nr:hypothetical protein [Acidimicrobiia bacterium]
MAVAVQESTTSVDFVVGAVVENHRARVEPSRALTLAEIIDAPVDVGAVRAVMAPAAASVEIVADAESSLHQLNAAAWGIAAQGLAVNVLVSLDRLGEAHSELRGAPCTLQGWWMHDGEVHFAGYERP